MKSRRSVVAFVLIGSFVATSAVSALPALAADGATLAQRCAGCHGKDGASTSPEVPIIGGYSAQYIVRRLRNVAEADW